MLPCFVLGCRGFFSCSTVSGHWNKLVANWCHIQLSYYSYSICTYRSCRVLLGVQTRVQESLMSFRFTVWGHFVFSVNYSDSGQRVVDKNCWHCLVKRTDVFLKAQSVTHTALKYLCYPNASFPVLWFPTFFFHVPPQPPQPQPKVPLHQHHLSFSKCVHFSCHHLSITFR